jgi:hypothetical protein
VKYYSRNENFMITLLYRKKILYPLFQTGDVVYGEGKLRDLGMVFKPSFKCFKNEKINFIQAFLKQETLLFRTCLYYFIIFYIYYVMLPIPSYSFFFIADSD